MINSAVQEDKILLYDWDHDNIKDTFLVKDPFYHTDCAPQYNSYSDLIVKMSNHSTLSTRAIDFCKSVEELDFSNNFVGFKKTGLKKFIPNNYFDMFSIFKNNSNPFVFCRFKLLKQFQI